MAALVLREGARFDPEEFERFLGEQPDLGTKMRPRYVRVASELPATATNKILKRELVRQGVENAGDAVWARNPRGTAYSRR
jgi:fatty-acyl-CoA synthase